VFSQKESIFEKILSPLPGGGAGSYLRYEPLYDDIRRAREEDDTQLSRGVWEIEYKRADFKIVESLSADALIHQTKDLQLAAWLGESWSRLHGMEGIVSGITLLNEFVTVFWDVMHPLDLEHRLRLLEWVDRDFNTILHTITLTSPVGVEANYNYYHHLVAKATDIAAKRDPQEANALLGNAQARGEISIAQFMTALDQTPVSFLKDKVHGLTSLEESLIALKKTLDEKIPKEAPSFSNLLKSTRDMLFILKPRVKEEEISNKDGNDESSESELVAETMENDPANGDFGSSQQMNEEVEVSVVNKIRHAPSSLQVASLTREAIYEDLRRLVKTFEKIEPHSPTTSILKTISQWEHKELPEILAFFNQGGDAMSVFLNFMKVQNTLPSDSEE